MNKLLATITLLCFSIGAIAQEKQIWACQQVKGTLLRWEESKWEDYGISPGTLLLTIDGNQSIRKEGDSNVPLECAVKFSIVECTADFTAGTSIVLDPETGKMGMSELYGALSIGQTRDTVSVEVFDCTKF